jgi:phosphoribosylformimino-5-aminoimidazole carboxamide ribotide isomerase
MKVYPAIDLLDGKCVRLSQGVFASQKIYSNSPIDVALDFEKQGCQFLHLIDLDGAKKGDIQQLVLIQQLLAATSLKVQIGGGIRTNTKIEQLLNAGADRIVVGSMAALEPNTVTKWLAQYGVNKLVLAFDVLLNKGMPTVMISGWQEMSGMSLWALLEIYENFNVEILCTDIACDGLLQGPNFELYAQCHQRFPNVSILVSGGVRSKEDIKQCSLLPNISGVVVGRALYENQLNMEDLLC